jgi:hypothetical protein
MRPRMNGSKQLVTVCLTTPCSLSVPPDLVEGRLKGGGGKKRGGDECEREGRGGEREEGERGEKGGGEREGEGRRETQGRERQPGAEPQGLTVAFFRGTGRRRRQGTITTRTFYSFHNHA